MQRTRLRGSYVALAKTSKVGPGGFVFQFAEACLLFCESAGGTDIAGEEYRGCRPKINLKARESGVDLVPAFFREGKTTFQPPRSDRHDIPIENVARMFQVGGKRQDRGKSVFVVCV